MPILRCYVSDDTMRILEREAVSRGNGETPEQLAENAIADAAIRAVPPPVRRNFDTRPKRSFLTEEEAKKIKQSDEDRASIERLQKDWTRRHGLARQMIVNRAIQRAKHAALTDR